MRSFFDIPVSRATGASRSMRAYVLFFFILRGVLLETSRGPNNYFIYDACLIPVSDYIYVVTSEAVTTYCYLPVECHYALCIFCVICLKRQDNAKQVPPSAAGFRGGAVGRRTTTHAGRSRFRFTKGGVGSRKFSLT